MHRTAVLPRVVLLVGAVLIAGSLRRFSAVAGPPEIPAQTTVRVVYAWGNNDSGQLGSGCNLDSCDTPVTVPFPEGVTITGISIGGTFNLALDATGSVWAWGDDRFGQLGPNCTRSPCRAPVLVPFPSGVTITAVAAGFTHGLALDATGDVWAWGFNAYRQLGPNCTVGPSDSLSTCSTPVVVPFPDNPKIRAVASGGEYNLALDAGGNVWAWGANDRKQLGPACTAESCATPALVPFPSGVSIAGIIGAGNYSLALDATGGVWAWGDNLLGELGPNGRGGPSCNLFGCAAPAAVPFPQGVSPTALAGAGGNSLALDTTGGVWEWGTEFRPGPKCSGDACETPETVPFPSGVSIVALAGADFYSLALDATGGAWFWGTSEYSDSVCGLSTCRAPVLIPFPGGASVKAIAAGKNYGLALATVTATASQPSMPQPPAPTATAAPVGTWANTGSMSMPRDAQTATLLRDGRVFVVAGVDSDLDSDIGTPEIDDPSTELYDPATGTWTRSGSLTAGRRNHTATLLTDGRVVVAGGTDTTTLRATASAEVYSLATGRWANTGAMTLPRTGHTATLLTDGRVLVTGGYAEDDGSLASAELFDPTTATWRATGSMAAAREGQTATLLRDGRVLVVGGAATDTGPSAELYDPMTGTWTNAGAALPPQLILHTANLLADGRVLVIGGLQLTGPLTRSAGATLFDPAAGTWSPTGQMSTARVGHTAVLLSNGEVLVAGGRGADFAPLSSAELYGPATGSWSATEAMHTPRVFCTATLLLNGNVLVAGGAPSKEAAFTTELYTP